MEVQPLALTFDDGPDPSVTPRLLELLGQAAASATFFPIAPRAAEHPRLIERILAAGHSVGLHCDRHVRHSARDLRWCRLDTERALSRLRRLGVAPTLWRTPWGDRAPWTGQVAAEHGLRLVGWSVDTHDWRGDSAAAMFAATRASLNAGAIVLAHDGIGPGAHRRSAAQTLAYTELVIDHARGQGLALRALR
ncbi:MAG: polysaccharide deacetylase family protein [Solirubrobacteraceae bacterium]